MSVLQQLKDMCEGQEYRGFPSREIVSFANEHGYVVIHGASDDLCEVEGVVMEEFGVGENTDFREWYDEVDHEDLCGRQGEIMKRLSDLGVKQVWYPRTAVVWEVTADEGNEQVQFTLNDGDEVNIGLIIKYI